MNDNDLKKFEIKLKQYLYLYTCVTWVQPTRMLLFFVDKGLGLLEMGLADSGSTGKVSS